MKKSRTLKAGLMIAMMNARDAMEDNYNHEFSSADLFFGSEKKAPRLGRVKVSHYTVDSPEVKAMSNQG